MPTNEDSGSVDELDALAEGDVVGDRPGREVTGEENVRVMVRCRPLMKPKERESCLTVDESDKCIELAERQFHFDAVFGPQSDNELVYMKSVRSLVESAFKGYNCTIFLYGQTGTGKTFTHSSLTLSSFAHLFSLIGDSNTQARFLIRASYYELYNENIRDLLSNSNKPLELRESKVRGVYVKDLTCYLVNNIADLNKLKKLGDEKRTTAATKMNEHSSRSHSIFSLTIETVNNDGSPQRTNNRHINNNRQRSSAQVVHNPQAVRVGRLHLIDLAGSERQSKSGSTGARLKEASRINLSLTCLSLVIRALTDTSSTHVPYRNSKLTRLLSGSLGGNSKTLLIACVSPARSSLDETLNTLRFASRTKRIKNKARINEDAKDALLRKYRQQIEELRFKLRQQRQSVDGVGQTTCPSGGNNGDDDEDDDKAINSLINEDEHRDRQQHPADDGATNDLLQQLKLLRGKIMIGGENLLEKAELHEKLLEASRNEIEEKRSEEMKLKQRLEQKRQIIEQMTQSKGSLESQVVDLEEKLKRALVLYKRTKEEQRDLTSEHQQLKESLLHSIRATSKEIKYADCIIEDFIPSEYLDLINTYAQYDDESDEWQIKYIALSGNNIAQTKMISEYKTTFLGSDNFSGNDRTPDNRIDNS